MALQILVSFSDGLFSVAMLNFRGVIRRYSWKTKKPVCHADLLTFFLGGSWLDGQMFVWSTQKPVINGVTTPIMALWPLSGVISPHFTTGDFGPTLHWLKRPWWPRNSPRSHRKSPTKDEANNMREMRTLISTETHLGDILRITYGKGLSSNHPFSGAMLVFGGVTFVCLRWFFTDCTMVKRQ